MLKADRARKDTEKAHILIIGDSMILNSDKISEQTGHCIRNLLRGSSWWIDNLQEEELLAECLEPMGESSCDGRGCRVPKLHRLIYGGDSDCLGSVEEHSNSFSHVSRVFTDFCNFKQRVQHVACQTVMASRHVAPPKPRHQNIMKESLP